MTVKDFNSLTNRKLSVNCVNLIVNFNLLLQHDASLELKQNDRSREILSLVL